MKDVKFLPWEGEKYQKGGFNGKKNKAAHYAYSQ